MSFRLVLQNSKPVRYFVKRKWSENDKIDTFIDSYFTESEKQATLFKDKIEAVQIQFRLDQIGLNCFLENS